MYMYVLYIYVLYIYIHVYIHIYIHLHTYIYIFVHKYIHIYIYINMYIYIHINTYLCIHIHTCLVAADFNQHILNMCINIHICTHTHIYIHIHVHIYKYTFTHVHVYKPVGSPQNRLHPARTQIVATVCQPARVSEFLRQSTLVLEHANRQQQLFYSNRVLARCIFFPRCVHQK